jgi:hypothetical protein
MQCGEESPLVSGGEGGERDGVLLDLEAGPGRAVVEDGDGRERHDIVEDPVRSR